MPIHEYGCSSCEYVFEVTILGPDDVPLVCPECGSERLHQYIGWKGMIGGEGKARAMSRPPPGNKITVPVTGNIVKNKK